MGMSNALEISFLDENHCNGGFKLTGHIFKAVRYRKRLKGLLIPENAKTRRSVHPCYVVVCNLDLRPM